MKEKIMFSYEDDELDLDEYIDDEGDDNLGEGYYQGYDDDDYQNPDSDYEDE
ncbi:hypothetical protein HpCK38_18270 [Helicobacter pylori]